MCELMVGKSDTKAMTGADLHQFLSVFLATLPMVGVIGWAAFNNSTLLNEILKRLDRIENELRAMGLRVNDHEVRIAKVETRLDNPRLVAK